MKPEVGKKFRILPVGQDAHVNFKLIGKKDHHQFCTRESFTNSSGDIVPLCGCPVKTDGVEIQCPCCRRVGTLFLKGGPTIKEDATQTQVAFEISGKADSISVKPLVYCLQCSSKFNITEGYAEYQGEVDLPHVKEADLPNNLTSFLQATDKLQELMTNIDALK